MIVSVSPNIALDRIAVVRGWRQAGQSRTQRVFFQAGGSGAHAAEIVCALSGDALAIGFLGGQNGARWREAAQAARLPVDMVAVEGETRESLCVVDTALGTIVESVADGPQLDVTDRDRLVAQVEAHLPHADLLIVSGSLPPGIPTDTYARLIESARHSGVRTLADVHSEPLRHALAAHPWMIKPNLSEFQRLLGRERPSMEERAAACRDLAAAYETIVTLSMGEDGLLLTEPEGQWLLTPPQVAMHLPEGSGVNVIGCGDALVGALAFEMVRSSDLLAAARLGLAAAHANLSTYGVPEIDPDVVVALAERVHVESIGP